MRFTIAALAAMAVISGANASQFNSVLFSEQIPSEETLQDMFTSYMKQFNKAYTHDEFFTRYNVFKERVERIRVHNAYSNESFTKGINEFSDLTGAEWKAKYLGYKPSTRAHGSAELHEIVGATATEVDWREKGVVTPVKNQGQCGSCWAFSATGSMEAAWALHGNDLVSLSEQELVDCVSEDDGCGGGLMDDAFEWVIKNGGITSEASYPYKAVNGKCTSSSHSNVVKISAYKDVTANSETSALLNAAGTIGPISIAVEADQDAWQDYSSGIINSNKCGKTLDHGVLIVGYDTAASEPYWIVKNSWGASWGEKGFVRLQYGKNTCGLAKQPSYPIV